MASIKKSKTNWETVVYTTALAVSLTAMFAFIGLKPVIDLVTKGSSRQTLVPEIPNLIAACDYTYPGCTSTFKYPATLQLPDINSIAKKYNVSPRLLLTLNIATKASLEDAATVLRDIKINNIGVPVPPVYVNRHGSYKLVSVNEASYHLILVLTHLVADPALYNQLLVTYPGETPHFVNLLNQLNP